MMTFDNPHRIDGDTQMTGNKCGYAVVSRIFFWLFAYGYLEVVVRRFLELLIFCAGFYLHLDVHTLMLSLSIFSGM